MSLARVNSAQPGALKANLVNVEADTSVGLYGFVIVGLPGKEVDEAKDRIPVAIKNSGLKSPKQNNRKIVVSLSPASLKKDGTQFDLPIAISYLLASQELNINKDFLKNSLFLGELSLSGEVLPVHGVLSVAKLCKEKKIQNLFVPLENKEEAALVNEVNVYPVKDLKQIVNFFKEKISKNSETIEVFKNTKIVKDLDSLEI
jgi:magnesium chelatase family protein